LYLFNRPLISLNPGHFLLCGGDFPLTDVLKQIRIRVFFKMAATNLIFSEA
jgi:hypothetical protein